MLRPERHTVSEANLAKGDHICVSRGLYAHHGIDIGGGRVIHYSGEPTRIWDAEVCITTREAFADGGTIRVLNTPKRYAGRTIVKRAQSRLGERRYNLVTNNCEHFAHWCRSGKRVCHQARRFAVVAQTVGRTLKTVGAPGGDLLLALGAVVAKAQPSTHTGATALLT